MTLKMVANLGKKIRQGKRLARGCMDRSTGKIVDFAGNTIKTFGKRK